MAKEIPDDNSPDKKSENPFEKWIGVFPAFSSHEELIAYWRDLRGHDEWDDAEDGYVKPDVLAEPDTGSSKD